MASTSTGQPLGGLDLDWTLPCPVLGILPFPWRGWTDEDGTSGELKYRLSSDHLGCGQWLLIRIDKCIPDIFYALLNYFCDSGNFWHFSCGFSPGLSHGGPLRFGVLKPVNVKFH